MREREIQKRFLCHPLERRESCHFRTKCVLYQNQPRSSKKGISGCLVLKGYGRFHCARFPASYEQSLNNSSFFDMMNLKESCIL